MWKSVRSYQRSHIWSLVGFWCLWERLFHLVPIFGKKRSVLGGGKRAATHIYMGHFFSPNKSTIIMACKNIWSLLVPKCLLIGYNMVVWWFLSHCCQEKNLGRGIYFFHPHTYGKQIFNFPKYHRILPTFSSNITDYFDGHVLWVFFAS